MRQENDKVIELIRRFPRRNLDEQASRRILSDLRHAADTEERNRERRKAWRISAAYLLAAAFLIAIPFLPALVEQAERSLARWLAPEPAQPWSVSPTFDLRDRDGTVVYPDRVRGIQGKIGFLDNGDLVAKARENVSKMFWYVWNEDADVQLTGKRLTATAVHQETGISFLLNETELQGPIYGADAHALTAFEPFPAKGLWRIDVYIDGELYGQIVVPVKDEYIQTDSFKFLVSREDAVVGNIENVLVMRGARDIETIDVRISSSRDGGVERTIPFRKGGVFLDAVTREPIVHYIGKLHFDRPGDWQIEVLGEKVDITVKEKPAVRR